ncbi:MAG TPA: hypothetical protein GX511_05175, partial [Firmicutes bacterium]|nr:hypothetical protein [Bacillota bacterium]
MLELFQEKRAELARLISLPNPEEVQAWLKSRPRRAALLARPALGARLNEGGGTEWFSVSQAGKPSCSFLTLTNAGRGAAGGEAPPGARLAEEIEELRRLVQAWPGEWGLELTGPDPRLAAEAAAAGGPLTWRGGPLETYFSLGRTGSLGALVDTWAYVEGLAQLYGARGIQVHREIQGVRGTALMPPGLSVAVLLIEAALAARGGSREVGLAYTPCGHLVQDGAAIRVLQRMAPAGIKVSVTCLAWPGGALAGFGGKAAAAAWTALTAALGGGARAEVVTLDTAEDSWEEGLERLAAAGGVA